AMPKAKIICTLGPASEKAAVLRRMIRCGMDVVRLNFSHGKPHECLNRVRTIRALNRTMRRHIRILGDLEGFRIRVGRFKDDKGLAVTKHQTIWLTQTEVSAGPDQIAFDYRGPLKTISAGQFIYIDDGNIELEAEGHDKKGLRAKVIVGGLIKSRKGINLPDLKIPFTGLGAKDKEGIRFCAEHKIDFIAQSFVRSARDIESVRQEMASYSHRPRIIAKIENREGIRNIESIIRVADGIMVARGDMGVSLPMYEVPLIQKEIIRKCKTAKKFVITATQMLESMTEHYRPTRAEVSDVANAILDGSDYVMLSGESAVGQYPVEAVDMMNRIIDFTEKNAGTMPRNF
ncbi:MAG: pyruvate kinase, partial [Candidatus Omnitrophota bacterium]